MFVVLNFLDTKFESYIKAFSFETFILHIFPFCFFGTLFSFINFKYIFLRRLRVIYHHFCRNRFLKRSGRLEMMLKVVKSMESTEQQFVKLINCGNRFYIRDFRPSFLLNFPKISRSSIGYPICVNLGACSHFIAVRETRTRAAITRGVLDQPGSNLFSALASEQLT